MTHLRSSLFLALSLAWISTGINTGCSSDEKLNTGSDDDEQADDAADEGDDQSDDEEGCDESKVGDDCNCDDDAEGSYACKKDKLECVCEEKSTSPSTDSKKDAGKAPAPAADGGTKPSGTTPPKGDAGAGPVQDPPKVDAGPMTPPPQGGQAGEPTIPAVSGECPEFKNGTVAVGGHKGVALTVGDAGKKGALLFYWHGTGGSAAEAMRTLPAAVRNEIIQGGGIIASFNGSQSAKTGADCSGTGAHNQADFVAADQIVACAVKNHGIDPHRIFSTGCSAGGLQTGCFATMRSSYVAAAAPNSGGIVFPVKWQDKHAPALFTMHGKRGAGNDQVIVEFADTSATLDKQFKDAGGFVVNCDHQGGHCAAKPDLQTAAWKFMNEHPFGVSPEPWKGGIPAGVPDYCKIF